MYIGPTGNFWLDGFAGVVATGANLTSILNAGWVHIACTVDSGSLEATWYINGAQQLPVPFGGPAWISGNDFTIGARDNLGSSPCALDMDEFVWREGLWSILDIQALFAEPRAAVANYTSGTSQGCGGLVTITSLGGRPTYGNLGFDLQVDHGAAVLVARGHGRTAGLQRASASEPALHLTRHHAPYQARPRRCRWRPDAPRRLLSRSASVPPVGQFHVALPDHKQPGPVCCRASFSKPRINLPRPYRHRMAR